MNKSDSDRIAAYLEDIGYKQAVRRRDASLNVLTTCGVRQSAEDRIYGLIPRIKKDNPRTKIIFSGCLTVRDDIKKKFSKYIDIWMPIQDLPKLASLLAGDKKNSVFSGSLDYLKLRAKHQSEISAFVPIGNGCDNYCTYCVVPTARGHEVYRPAEDIINEVAQLLKNGCKEITLIAQNVNSYKIPNTNKISNVKEGSIIDFVDLLYLVNDLPGNFWLRFATSHPKDMSEELITAIAECEKVCEYVHLPIQSGDDEILRSMNRKYSSDDYFSLVEKIRKKIKSVSISTDIIVGFPGETDEQFNNTVKIFDKVKFDQAYISEYSPRPGTAALKLPDNVGAYEKKARKTFLNDLLKKYSLEFNKKQIGKVLPVLIEAQNKNKEFIGHTRTNKKVRISPSRLKKKVLGEFVNTKITSAEDFGLSGEIL